MLHSGGSRHRPARFIKLSGFVQLSRGCFDCQSEFCFASAKGREKCKESESHRRRALVVAREFLRLLVVFIVERGRGNDDTSGRRSWDAIRRRSRREEENGTSWMCRHYSRRVGLSREKGIRVTDVSLVHRSNVMRCHRDWIPRFFFKVRQSFEREDVVGDGSRPRERRVETVDAR